MYLFKFRNDEFAYFLNDFIRKYVLGEVIIPLLGKVGAKLEIVYILKEHHKTYKSRKPPNL